MDSSLVYLIAESRILVLGDIIIDEFVIGRPDRISREAPVIIMEEIERHVCPGGAANAAANAISLGGKTELLGVVGADNNWQRLAASLDKGPIEISGVVVSEAVDSAVKTRVMAGGKQLVRQQIVRIDNTRGIRVTDSNRTLLLSRLQDKIADFDVLILSDYGLGVFTGEFIAEVIELAREAGIPVLADSRYQLLDFTGVTLATPNLEETSRAWGQSIDQEADIIEAGRQLIARLSSEYLLITRGAEGMSLFYQDGGYQHIPVNKKAEVYDVTGAGDTVAAVLALSLGAGLNIEKGAKLANFAAGLVVEKPGVDVVHPEELVRVIADE